MPLILANQKYEGFERPNNFLETTFIDEKTNEGLYLTQKISNAFAQSDAETTMQI